MQSRLTRLVLAVALAAAAGYLVSDSLLFAQDADKGKEGKGKFEKGKFGKFGKGAPEGKKDSDEIAALKARIAELEAKLQSMMAAKEPKGPPAKDEKKLPKFDFKKDAKVGFPPFGPGFGGKGGPPFGPGFGGKGGFPAFDPKMAEKFKEFSEKVKKLRDEYFPPKAEAKEAMKKDFPGRGKGGPPMGFGRGGFGKIEAGSMADISRRLDRIASEIEELRKMIKSK